MPLNLEPARLLGPQMGERLGEKFLGWREDRDELTFWVHRDAWVQTATWLKHETTFNVLQDLNVVDYADRDPRFDLAIILVDIGSRSWIRLKTLIPEEPAEVASLTGVWPGANWYEREMWDLFGVRFLGHPDLRRLLLPADYQGHPLRKDYPVTGPPTSVYR